MSQNKHETPHGTTSYNLHKLKANIFDNLCQKKTATVSSHCSKCPELQDTEEHSYFRCSCKPFKSVSIRNSTVTKPSKQSWASTRVLYLKHLCLLLSYLSLLHHRRHGRDRWDVLSSFAPLPINLSLSVTCRGIERLPPSEKTFPPTDTFYI